jgi:hypothetical protein
LVEALHNGRQTGHSGGMYKVAGKLALVCSFAVIGNFAASVAAAAPAVVRGTEARVLESAAPDAKVVQTLPPGTKVDAADTATDGKRRIKLPSGIEGFIDDAALEPVTETPAGNMPEPPQACTCAAKERPVRLPVFVVDWGHLAGLTKSDPDVLAVAENGEKRARGASLLGHGGVGVGLAVTFVGFLRHVQTGQWSKGTELTFAGGLVMAALSALAAWNYAPDHGDLADAVNLWNLRHPDRPLAP